VSIIDNASEKMLTLMSGMIGKRAIQGTTTKKEDEPAPKFTVELINETKEIAGYKCKKAVVKDEDGTSYNFWYTEEIKMNAKGQKYFDAYGIPGFPMEMEFIQNGMNVKMVATSIEKSLPKKHTLFNQDVPEGYQLTTAEELEKMMGGMK
jgi:GLPGLI family protein